jgi:hypothetical protein
MEFTLYTLVDITETGERRGQDRVAIGEQANYDTLIQVIGLRVNPTPKGIKQHKGSISKLGFGSDFKGSHAYWELRFDIEYGATSLEMLEEDFDLVPVITQLKETAKINISVFKTKDPAQRNIVFKCADND